MRRLFFGSSLTRHSKLGISGDLNCLCFVSYFASRTETPAFFQVHRGIKDYEVRDSRTRVLPFTTFAAEILRI